MPPDPALTPRGYRAGPELSGTMSYGIQHTTTYAINRLPLPFALWRYGRRARRYLGIAILSISPAYAALTTHSQPHRTARTEVREHVSTIPWQRDIPRPHTTNMRTDSTAGVAQAHAAPPKGRTPAPYTLAVSESHQQASHACRCTGPRAMLPLSAQRRTGSTPNPAATVAKLRRQPPCISHHSRLFSRVRRS